MEMWASQKIQPFTLSHVVLCPTPTAGGIRHPIFVSIIQHYLCFWIHSFIQPHLLYSGITNLKLHVSCFWVLVKQVSKPVSRLIGLEEVTDNYLIQQLFSSSKGLITMLVGQKWKQVVNFPSHFSSRMPTFSTHFL